MSMGLTSDSLHPIDFIGLSSTIRSVHVELTTKCNALCPMCPRTGRGTAKKGLVLQELSLDDIKVIFPVPLLSSLNHIDLCGGFGDPLVAGSFDQILEYLLSFNRKLSVNIFTNGSLRSPEWWSALSERLGPQGRVIFGIDGLADTHGLYRVNTSYERVLGNARAFIASGGRAQWDYLVFRHNQHQVDDARRLAVEFGFESFSPKVSGRFYKRLYEETPDIQSQHGMASFPVYDDKGHLERELELPTDPRFANPTLDKIVSCVSAAGSLDESLDGACISCRALTDKSCFVSAEGSVFPCCWTYGASKYGSIFGMSNEDNLQIAALLDLHGGPESINAKFIPMERIISGQFFRAIEQSWHKSRIARGKAKICARMCGGIFSQEEQFVDRRLSPWQAIPSSKDKGAD